ncbi:MAG: nuclear transport factor 2 family protein [Cyanobacteria bacterium P01_A01_bin.83]
MKRFATILLINCSVMGSFVNAVQSQNKEAAPDELTEIISEIEEAANNRDLERLMEYHDQDFTNTDGLTADTLTKAVTQMWDKYPQLEYSTEIQSWSESENGLVAETITTIKGVKNIQGRKTSLDSTIKSRQYFEEDKLQRQEILAEQSKLTSGDNPPQVEVVAPSTVKPGAKYNFDLIVNEPLGDRVLLGGVQEEKTAGNLYLNPTAIELEPLPAGGIYKVATAPLLPDSNWLSAVLVRGDGITMITHRVNIQEDQEDQEELVPLKQ